MNVRMDDKNNFLAVGMLNGYLGVIGLQEC